MDTVISELQLSKELQEIKNEVFENVPFTYEYDQVIILDSRSTPDWELKSKYLQKNLWQMGVFPESGMMPVDATALVGYTYPKESDLETGLFFTNRAVEKNIMVGLPGCGGYGANDRPYWGILVHKDSSIEICMSYGNHLCEPLSIPIGAANVETAQFVDSLLKYWAPVKSL
ncbi:hypothetical protein KKA50_02030 [Patescibacteria group bacterium]|nr:hypothetical protein [Patescibacteria group bacterium]